MHELYKLARVRGLINKQPKSQSKTNRKEARKKQMKQKQDAPTMWGETASRRWVKVAYNQNYLRRSLKADLENPQTRNLRQSVTIKTIETQDKESTTANLASGVTSPKSFVTLIPTASQKLAKTKD